MTDSYKSKFKDMVWSYSRISAFKDCPYKFFLQYLYEPKLEKSKSFYSSYGSFIHELIERYYLGELKKDELTIEFLAGFENRVVGKRPSEKIATSYIEKGVKYFDNFEEFKYEPIEVEKEIRFSIGDVPFIGIIDYLGKDGDDLVLIDHKSRDLKQRSGRKKPTKKDEELDEMLRQLYIYSSAIEQEYGKLPTKLCFNCFKNGEFIEEKFDKNAYEKALKWAKDYVEEIKNTLDFFPNGEFFLCNYLCDVKNDCMYRQ